MTPDAPPPEFSTNPPSIRMFVDNPVDAGRGQVVASGIRTVAEE
jgi:hypothetical protein